MSVIKHPEQRVAVLIDAQNLYHSAKNLYRRKVNFNKVLTEAVAGRKLVRAIAYVITSEAGDEKNFFEALGKAGIETRTKDLQVFAGGAKKADWDVGLAIDAIKLSKNVDAIIFASGDGDFVPAVEYIKSTSGCQVEGISFGKSTSSKFIAAVDDFVNLDEGSNDFLIFNKKSRRKITKPKGGVKKI